MRDHVVLPRPGRAAVGSALLALSLGRALAAAQGSIAAEQMVVVPYQDAKYVPLDPGRPDGPRIAVLWGDPATGPSAMLMKFKKSSGRLHYHTSDYDLVVLEGQMKDWGEGPREEDVRPLGPGSAWHQPGNLAHTDSCLSDECVMFIKWAGKRDAHLYTSSK